MREFPEPCQVLCIFCRKYVIEFRHFIQVSKMLQSDVMLSESVFLSNMCMTQSMTKCISSSKTLQILHSLWYAGSLTPRLRCSPLLFLMSGSWWKKDICRWKFTLFILMHTESRNIKMLYKMGEYKRTDPLYNKQACKMPKARCRLNHCRVFYHQHGGTWWHYEMETFSA